MASGPIASPEGFKYFLYAAEREDLLNANMPIYLAQILYYRESGDIVLTAKVANSSNSSISINGFKNVLINGLQRFNPIV